MKVKGEVYSVSGRLVFRGEGRISLPAGVYFVKVRGKVFKVVLRRLSHPIASNCLFRAFSPTGL